MHTEKRSFAIVKVERKNGSKVNIEQGRYISASPSAAAKKIYSQVAQVVSKVSSKFMEPLKVHIRESTAGAKNDKVYSYSVKREKLAEPILRVIKGQTITYKYNVVAKAL